MYSDLLDVLGGGAGGPESATRRREAEKHVAVSAKAGKMTLTLQENGKYWVTPDTRRGTLQLVWQDAGLKWEWMDRRTKAVVDSVSISNEGGGSFEKIIPTANDKDRVYLWTNSTTERTMYWLQDASDEGDDEFCTKVNQYLMNPSEAAPEGHSGTLSDANPLLQGGGASSEGSSTTGQVDALSNILENLGMPQQPAAGGAPATASSTAAAAPASSTATTGTLTLSDLQGAMAGLATASPTTTSSSVGPPLSEVVTPASVSSLLEDEAAAARLLRLLPEEQQSVQYLEDNLRSPQLQQTLRTLTQLVLPDDAGSLEGYHSLIANFQLDPAHGEETLRETNNPIQAFLDCIIASVKDKEEKEETKEEEEETKDDEEAMQE